MIIGVVAVLTIPTMVQSYKDKLYENQRKIFSAKLDEGFRRMRVDGKLSTAYSSTLDFVAEMQKYFNIVQTCETNNLSSCFSQEFTAISPDQKTKKIFKPSEIQTAAYLSKNFSDYYNPVSFKLSDGSSFILIYKPDCTGVEENNTMGDLYSCIGYVADVNNVKKPNLSGKDIISNIDLIYDYGLDFSMGEGFAATSLTPYTIAQCEEAKKKGAPIPVCNSDIDYWSAAIDKCYKEGKTLPTYAQLNQIASKIYNQELSQATTGLTIVDMDLYNKMTHMQAGGGRFVSSTPGGSVNSYWIQYMINSTGGNYNWLKDRNDGSYFCISKNAK